ncbi:hypothetical protein L873DRAFT_1799657 [Choiromyces venosus 120613-1]|uniref:Uncharacterized protein n=1 Tax=Choiromyces venosus 120613-1 TaxID=1336337 RepID=A0A3N4K1K5_9PEZI|nr:hypothetical protein L873DRAFT_1799657 [Choiromyces venosus 120613-1]
MSEGLNQPNLVIDTIELEATTENTLLLPRALAHISSSSFIPPIPIEHPESPLLFVTTTSSDSPLVITVATEKDYDESGPMSVPVRYPMSRDTNGSWSRPVEFFTPGLVSVVLESVSEGSKASLNNTPAESLSAWIEAQGIGEEDPIIYGNQELSQEWWFECQEASESVNLWIGQILAVKDRKTTSDGVEIS